jgi:predicted DNA-binding mobile mystery protein A
MNNQWLTIHQLDKQITDWQILKEKYGQPRSGWIKTLRVALSMSAEQLAKRLGLTRGRINQLENAEIHDSVTLRALKEAANALGCELIYAIVPKGNSTLETVLKNRASQVANEQVARVAHSMSLEAQSVDEDTIKIQKEMLTKSLLENLNKKLWENQDKYNNLVEAIYTQMQKNNKLEMLNKKGLINNLMFINELKKYLTQLQKEKTINETELLNKFNDPTHINALRNALIRYQTHNKKQSKQSYLIKNSNKILKTKK